MISIGLFSLLNPLLSFLFAMAFQIIYFLQSKKYVVKTLIYAFFLGVLLNLTASMIAYFYFFDISFANTIFYSISGICFFTVIYYNYFHYVNVGEASVRIRILNELVNQEKLSLSNLLGKYSHKQIVKNRLDRLTSSGEVKLYQGRYFLQKPRLILMAKVFEFLKLVILGRKNYKSVVVDFKSFQNEKELSNQPAHKRSSDIPLK